MNPLDVRPGMVVEGRDGEHVLVLGYDGPTPCGYPGRIFHGPDLRVGRPARVFAPPGRPVEVIALPVRALVLADRRDGGLVLWDDTAGKMVELAAERVAGGLLRWDLGTRMAVRYYHGRPVWVDGPAAS